MTVTRPTLDVIRDIKNFVDTGEIKMTITFDDNAAVEGFYATRRVAEELLRQGLRYTDITQSPKSAKPNFDLSHYPCRISPDQFHDFIDRMDIINSPLTDQQLSKFKESVFEKMQLAPLTETGKRLGKERISRLANKKLLFEEFGWTDDPATWVKSIEHLDVINANLAAMMKNDGRS